MKTLKERYVAALLARGSTLVKRNFKHDVYSRPAGGFYYVGRAGALRVGHTAGGSSVPCSNKFKAMLLGEEYGGMTNEEYDYLCNIADKPAVKRWLCQVL